MRMSSYQALYGRLPPTLIPYTHGKSKVASLDEMLVQRDAMQMKEHLVVSRNRMVVNANRKRQEVDFAPGDSVLVKL